MHIAYLVNRYPAVSHSFIRREITAIEAAGHRVRRFSIRAAGNLPDEADRDEAGRTETLLAEGWRPLLASTFRVAFGRPTAFFRGLRLALAMSRGRPRDVPRHIAYLVEASDLLLRLNGDPVDHLHAHFGTNPAAVARLLRCLGGPRYSFTVHGPEEFDAPVELDLPGKVADSVLVAGVSSFGRSQLMRWSDPADWSKIAVIRCGIDAAFLNAEPSAIGEAATLCCIARLSAQKGLPLLIEAAAQLLARGIDFRLTIVGDGELRPMIEAMIAHHRLQDHVILAGTRDGAGVRQAIIASRAMVLPSFAEGLPVVIMEALALGRPVIASAIAGTPELVDNDCGWLIPAGNVEALADAMASALAAPTDRLDAMGAVGRSRVLARHDATKNGAELAGRIAALG